MKIETGKFYETRNGDKARVYEVYEDNDELHGAIFLNGNWEIYTWNLQGQMLSSPTIGDLIKEWTEKPTFNNWDDLPSWINAYVAMDRCGGWWSYSKKPFKEYDYFTSTGKTIRIPSHLTTPFEGDWRDSLIKNPKL